MRALELQHAFFQLGEVLALSSLQPVAFFDKTNFARSSFIVMAELSEESTAVKFCLLLGKNAVETKVMIS